MATLKQCVIVNPSSGTPAQKEGLAEALGRLGPVQIFETSVADDALRIARQAVVEGYGRVIAAGGDGTLNEVLNGLMDGGPHDGSLQVQLGLIPLGTANDFARSVAIPASVEQAVAVLAAGQTRRLDVGRLSVGALQRYFINVSAGGFSTLVNEKLEKGQKDWWRSLAYALSAVKALPELEEYRLRLTFDDEPPQESSAYNLVVANASYVGGAIPVAPRARLDDGLLDVIVFRALPMTQVALLVPKTLLGEHLDDEGVLFRQVRSLQVQSDPPFSLNTDGELTGYCPARFDVLPQALEVVVGHQPEAAA